jgi:hypothetical protein
MRRRVLLTAAIAAAVFLYFFQTLPPRPRATAGTVDDALCRRTVAGAFHVHSSRSDGTGSIDEIAAAAARAGLHYVIVTDHGDGVRRPDPPQYLHGVLVIDAVEISTNQGHLIAIDAPAAPYPLGGEARDVVEDVGRLGGFAVAAHPDSPKPELRWTAWDAAVDGVEWLNLDSEWRDESRRRLARTAVDYPFGKGPALAALLDRPAATHDRWAAQGEQRAVVAVAGHDAHGGIGEGAGRGSVGARLGVPSYEASFRTFALRAILEKEPTGNAVEDAAAIVAAIRHGGVFTAIDAVATPAFVDLRASAGGVDGVMGQTIPHARDARITVRSMVPPGGRIVLIRGGREVAHSESDELIAPADAPGAYRVEVRAGTAPGPPSIPWAVTNPIYLRAQARDHGPVVPTYSTVTAVAGPPQVEKDPASNGSIRTVDGGFALDYQLRSGDRASQFVAASMPMPQGTDASGIAFDVRSNAPMRVSVQLRFADPAFTRWVRSVYVSPESRRVTVPFRELVHADGARTPPAFSNAASILFVVDLTNARPGQSGTFEITALNLVR